MKCDGTLKQVLVEPQLTCGPAFPGGDFGWLFSTSCCRGPPQLPPAPPRLTPQPLLSFAWGSNQWHWQGWGRGWPSFSPHSPSTPRGNGRSWCGWSPTLWLLGVSKPTAISKLQLMMCLVGNVADDLTEASHSRPAQIPSTSWPRDS